MENITLEVFSIFNEAKGFSEVSINTELFKLIAGNDESVKLPIVSKGKDLQGRTIRKFEVNGTPVWVRYNGKDAQYPSTVILKTEDARKFKDESGVVFNEFDFA